MTVNGGYLVPQFAVLRSRDDGQTWAAIPPNPTLPGVGPARTAGYSTKLAVAPSDPATVYVSHSSGITPSGLYVSRNSGETWSTSTLPDAPATGGAPPVGLTVDPRDPASIWLTTESGRLYNSRNAGATWQKVLSDLKAPQPVQMYWPRKGKEPWLLTSTSQNLGTSQSGTYFNYQSTPQVSADGGRNWKTLAPLEMHTNDGSVPLHPTFAFDQYGRVLGVTLLNSGTADQPVVMRLSGETWREQGAAIGAPRGLMWEIEIAQTAERRPKLVIALQGAAAPSLALAEYALR